MKNPIVIFKLSKMLINMFRCNWIRTVNEKKNTF